MRELEIRGWERYGGGRTEGGRKGARGKGVQVKGVRKVKLGEGGRTGEEEGLRKLTAVGVAYNGDDEFVKSFC